MFTPQGELCADCGEWVPQGSANDHRCNPDRVEARALAGLRAEFSNEVSKERSGFFWRPWTAWLETHAGHFAVFYAERTRP